LNSFVLANLVGLPIAIYFGSDLNGTHVWFYLALGFIVSKLKIRETAVEVSSQPGMDAQSPPKRFRPAITG